MKLRNKRTKARKKNPKDKEVLKKGREGRWTPQKKKKKAFSNLSRQSGNPVKLFLDLKD